MKTKLNLLTLTLLTQLSFSVVKAETLYQFEQVPENEQQAIDRVTEIESTMLTKAHTKNPEELVRRDAHAKAHGCVQAKFEVEKNIPSELQEGIFQAGAIYNSWVRYSNGNGQVQKDQTPDGRGMAIKVYGLKNQQTQDFLMINHSVFFVRDAADYVIFQEQIAKTGNPASFFLTRPLEAANALETALKPIGNPLAVQYWSMTPYALGKSKAIKYSAKPCGIDPLISVGLSFNGNYLEAAMKEQLESAGACFELMVQVAPTEIQSRGENQIVQTRQDFPVEDPRIDWNESVAPFRTVAKIKIARQSFDSAEQIRNCENLSFTPWHTLPEHRPLGGINRVRKAVYESISQIRHQANGVERQEP